MSPDQQGYRDQFGYQVTTASRGTIVGIDAFASQVLCHGKQAARILDAVEADPDAPLAQAYAAALYLFLQNAEGPKRAAPHLDALPRLKCRANHRERLIINAVEAWAENNFQGTVDAFGAVLERYPGDLIVAKLRQIHQFNAGDAKGLLETGQRAVEGRPDNHFAYGLRAFGMEQCHRLRDAEADAMHALSLNRHDPWAQHAIAHVYDTMGRVEEGTAFMQAHADTWEACSSFMYTHNWWHAALFAIDRGDFEAALAMFDRHIWAVRKDYCQDQINAIAMLARLELQGVDVGSRWQEVGRYVTARIGDHVNGFLDLHFVYALAKAGLSGELERMMTSLRHHAEVSAGHCPEWRDIAWPAAQALTAHAQGRFDRAAFGLEPLRNSLHKLGGSHAQRDLFEQIFLDSLIQSAATSPARQILARRISARRAVLWQHDWLEGLSNRGALIA